MELYIYYSIIIFGIIILSLYAYIFSARIIQRRSSRKLYKYKKSLIPFIDKAVEHIEKGLSFNLHGQNNLIKDISKNKLKKQIAEDRIIYHLEICHQPFSFELEKFLEAIGIIDQEIKQLSKHNHYARALACKKLGELKSRKAIPYLLQQAASDSPDVTYNALLALAHIGDAKSFSEAFEHIPSSTRLSERSLLEIADSFAGAKPDIYLKMIESDNELISRIFIKSAGSCPSEALAEKVAAFLKSDSKEKVIAAIKSLTRMQNTFYLDSISDFLSHESWEIRAVTAKALGNYQEASIVSKLINALSDSHWFVRYNAANSILAIDKALSSIVQVFEGKDRFAKDIIISALEDHNILSLYLSKSSLSSPFDKKAEELIRNYRERGCL